MIRGALQRIKTIPHPWGLKSNLKTFFSPKMTWFATQPLVFQEAVRVAKTKSPQPWGVMEPDPYNLHILSYNKGIHPHGWLSESPFPRSWD